MIKNKNQLITGSSLIGLLITLIIIVLLIYLALNYVNESSTIQSPDTSKPKSVLDDARETVEEVNKQQLNRIKELK